MYNFVRASTLRRSQRWTKVLATQWLIALWSTFSLAYILHTPKVDPYWDSDVSEDLFYLVMLGRETAFVCVVMYLVLQVNDHADSITAVLIEECWGEPGSKEECTRQDLIQMTQVYSVRPEVTSSLRLKMITLRQKPITFHILHLRPCGDLFVAFVVSVMAAFLSAFAREATAT